MVRNDTIIDMNRVNFAGVVCEQNGSVLLVQEQHEKARGLWSFPLGCCEVYESYKVGAMREAKEETGLEISITGPESELVLDNRHFKSTYEFDDAEIHLHLYPADVQGGVLLCGTDVMDVQWVKKADVHKLPLRGEWVRRFV